MVKRVLSFAGGLLGSLAVAALVTGPALPAQAYVLSGWVYQGYVVTWGYGNPYAYGYSYGCAHTSTNISWHYAFDTWSHYYPYKDSCGVYVQSLPPAFIGLEYRAYRSGYVCAAGTIYDNSGSGDQLSAAGKTGAAGWFCGVDPAGNQTHQACVRERLYDLAYNPPIYVVTPDVCTPTVDTF